MLGHDRLSERVAALIQRIEADLPALLAASTVSDLQTRAHAMAGLCGIFGIDRLYALLGEIESACKDDDWLKAQDTVELLPGIWQQTRTALRQKIAGPA